MKSPFRIATLLPVARAARRACVPPARRVMCPTAAVALLLLALSGCGSDATKPEPRTVADYFSGIELDGGTSVRKTGSSPAANGGPTVTASGNTIVINGGTSRVTVASPAAMAKLLIGVDGIDGYYEVTLAAPSTSLEFLINVAQGVPGTSFDILIQAAGADGRFGPTDNLPTSITRVGTGDVQVSLSWDADSDVDLHVVDPKGEEVYWKERTVSSGGQLDLDSNAACSIDGLRNENVTWPTGTAPRGTYTVRVDYFLNCGVDTTRYVVTVRKNGMVDTFTGVLTGEGDAGSAGSGELVTTFTY